MTSLVAVTVSIGCRRVAIATGLSRDTPDSSADNRPCADGAAAAPSVVDVPGRIDGQQISYQIQFILARIGVASFRPIAQFERTAMKSLIRFVLLTVSLAVANACSLPS
jgi:hypothetical protein